MLPITLLVISLLLLACNFLLAPVIRLMLLFPRGGTQAEPSPLQSISIVIPAYNEEKNIAGKIDTLLHALEAVDLPFEVIIGSDGSTDRTLEVARACLQKVNDPRWRLVEFANEGKCRTLNKLVGLAGGEVIISTDADIPLPGNAIETVVEAFRSSSRLGCISCIPCFKGLDIGSQHSYWRLEDSIRYYESRLGKLIVVTGMLYAYRRRLFVEIPDGVMADDLWVPLNVLLQGYESRQVNELLIPYEKTDEVTEIRRRKRVIVGGMDVIRRLLPSIARNPTLLLLVLFHKVNRWALPVWLLIFLLATVNLLPWLLLAYPVLLLPVLALCGVKKCWAMAYAVLSPVMSFAEVLLKRDFARWEHTRMR